jgi:hypothetical protein
MVGKWLVFGVACVLFGCSGKSTTDEEQGTDCVSLCEKGKEEKCPGAEQLRCEDNCLGEDVRVEATGCRSEYTKVHQCTAELEDICTVRTACKAQLTALFACYAEYCVDHPSSAFCAMDG